MAQTLIGKLNIMITASAKGLKQAVAQSVTSLQGLQRFATRTFHGIGRAIALISPVGGLGRMFSIMKLGFASALGAGVAWAVKLSAEAEQVQIAFEVMLRSGERAKSLIRELRIFASATPFRSQESIDAARELIAYGFAVDNVIPTLRVLGEVAAATGTPLADLTYLFGTLKTQGRAFARDLYQFAGRGIPIWEELAKVFGVRKHEVFQLLEAGRVGFTEVAQAFKNMTEQGDRYGGLMARQAQTLRGRWEAFRDNLEITLIRVGDLIVEELGLKQVLFNATQQMREFTANIERARPAIRAFAQGLKATLNVIWIILKQMVAGIEVLVTLLRVSLPDSMSKLGDGVRELGTIKLTMHEARLNAIDFFEAITTGFASVMDGLSSFRGWWKRNITDPIKGAGLELGVVWAHASLDKDAIENAEKRLKDFRLQEWGEGQLREGKGPEWIQWLKGDISGKLAQSKGWNDEAYKLKQMVGLEPNMPPPGHFLEVYGGMKNRMAENPFYTGWMENADVVLEMRSQFDRMQGAARRLFQGSHGAVLGGGGLFEFLLPGKRPDELGEGNDRALRRALNSRRQNVKEAFALAREQIQLQRTAELVGDSEGPGLIGGGPAAVARLLVDTGQLKAIERQYQAAPMEIPVELVSAFHADRAKEIAKDFGGPLDEFTKNFKEANDLLFRGAFPAALGKVSPDAQDAMLAMFGGGGSTVPGLRPGWDVANLKLLKDFKSLADAAGMGEVKLASAAISGTSEATSAVNRFMTGADAGPSGAQRVVQAIEGAKKILDAQLKAAHELRKAIDEKILPQVVLP